MKVGITGHRNLDRAEKNWLSEELKNEISHIKIEAAYSSLAIGTDQIFAKIILEKNIRLIAVIPCKKYEGTFKSDEIKEYRNFLAVSTKIIQLDYDEPSDEAFFEAGKAVVNSSDILFACWNNLPAKGLGGTADIVSYAKRLNKKIVHFNPFDKTKKKY